MIDLATATGSDAPVLMDEGLPLWMDRLATDLSADRGAIGFSDRGVEVEGDYVPDRPGSAEAEQTSPIDFLDNILVRSRRDVERHPNSARAYANLGFVFLNRGYTEDAAAAFERALQLDPSNAVAARSLARTKIYQEELEEAKSLFLRLRERDPKDLYPVMGLAEIAEKEERTADALQLWQEASEIRPTSSAVLSNFAALLLRAGHYREAIARLKQATRNDVHSAGVHSALGVAYAMASDRPRAVKSFRIALSLNRHKLEAVHGLASVLLELGRITEAIDLLTDHVDQVSGDADAHELLASAHARLDDYKTARRHWFKALQAAQDSSPDAADHQARLLNNLGVCFIRLNAVDEAQTHLRKSISLSPNVSIPYQNLAHLWIETRHEKEAVQLLTACKRQFPDDERIRLMLAYALDSSEDSEQAIAELEEWIGQKAASHAAWTALGYLYTDGVHQPEQAIAVLREALSRWPDDGLIANNLAYAYLMNGLPAEARQVLEALSPNAYRDEAANVVLQATWGLLRLWEGDFVNARRGYEGAIAEANRLGFDRLAANARQKLHLELARRLQRDERVEDARKEALAGSNLPGSRHTRRELRTLLAELRESEH